MLLDEESKDKVKKLFAPIIGKASWCVFSGTGGVFAMNYGKMKHKGRYFVSEYHVMVTSSNWRILINEELHVASSDSRLRILERIAILQGKILNSIEIDLAENKYVFKFDYDISFGISLDPSVDEKGHTEAVVSDWMLFSPRKVVAFGPGPYYEIESSTLYKGSLITS